MEKDMYSIENSDINILLHNKITGSITPNEEVRLNEWINATVSNRELYNRIMNREVVEVIESYEAIDTKRVLNKYHSKYNDINYTKDRRGYSKAIRLVAAASIAAVAIIISLLLGTKDNVINNEQLISYGDSKVTLILSGGEQMDLKNDISVDIKDVEDVDISSAQDGLSYVRKNDKRKQSDKIIYNTLKTGVGGNYKIKLSDGSSVWLNSNSSLRYPVAFGANERVVYLEGEAFFDIKRDEKLPFIVKTYNELEINVLGTSFNVNAYAGGDKISTVLVEGRVALHNGESRTLLEAGMMGEYNNNSGVVEVKSVDTNIYTSWRDGEFVFQNETIVSILDRLRLWYEFEVEYENESVKSERFSGSLKRKDDVRLFMEIIELSGGVSFEVEGRLVKVKTQEMN